MSHVIAFRGAMRPPLRQRPLSVGETATLPGMAPESGADYLARLEPIAREHAQEAAEEMRTLKARARYHCAFDQPHKPRAVLPIASFLHHLRLKG